MRNALIADDHEVTRRGLREILRDAFDGIEVYEAGDGASVLGQLSNRTWDLILVDVMMPGTNVIDLLTQIRAENASVPILVLTAATETEYATQTLKAGANGFIHKHRAADDLVNAIRAVANGGTYLHAETATAIAVALRETSAPVPHTALSERELVVFCKIARGLTVKQIAFELGVSDKTIATYVARIREKTGINSFVEIARYALQNGLVD